MSSRFVNPFTDLGFKIIFGQLRQQPQRRIDGGFTLVHGR